MNYEIETTKKNGHHDLQPREKPVHEARAEGTREGPWFEPPVDIHETAEALVIRADMPGVLPEDVETDVKDSVLTITARTRPVSPDGAWKPIYAEYREGHYLRQFQLGQQIDQAKISASLKDGVLTLTLPKAEHARPRKIQVHAG